MFHSTATLLSFCTFWSIKNTSQSRRLSTLATVHFSA